MRKTVLIVRGNPAYSTLFKAHGWTETDDIRRAALVQFTGGPDVSPELYGQKRHPKTYSDPKRDEGEKELFNQAQALGLATAGICRGAQFLNVMCGGSLYQDVDGHCNGQHDVFDLTSELSFKVTSTHHQMMIPGDGAKVLLVAWEAKRKERMAEAIEVPVVEKASEYYPDIEALVYEKSRVVCFQPHPEYSIADKLCRNAYFNYLERYCK